jgi:hypothetical protein
MDLQEQYRLAKHLKDALDRANKKILELEKKIKKLEQQKNDSSFNNEQSLYFKD